MKGAPQKTHKNGTAGRPLFDGKDAALVLQKLEWAFSIGATDLEACNHAEISKSALYAYQKKHPEFLDRKEVLKQSPTLKARHAIYSRLDDPDFAMRYMERKKKDEFSPRHEWTGADGKPLESISADHAKKIARALLASQGDVNA